jgi:hypothetical protein
MIVARLVGTGGFLIIYSTADTKQTHRKLKKFRDYLKTITPLVKNI